MAVDWTSCHCLQVSCVGLNVLEVVQIVSTGYAVIGVLTFNSLHRVCLQTLDSCEKRKCHASAELWTSASAGAVASLLKLVFARQVYTAIPVDHYRRVLEGTMAAALIAPVLVVALNIVSLFVLFYKTWRHAGTGYG